MVSFGFAYVISSTIPPLSFLSPTLAFVLPLGLDTLLSLFRPSFEAEGD